MHGGKEFIRYIMALGFVWMTPRSSVLPKLSSLRRWKKAVEKRASRGDGTPTFIEGIWIITTEMPEKNGTQDLGRPHRLGTTRESIKD